MKDKQSKKVVIINDIKSDAIEQAILILRSSGSSPESVPPGYHIVTEAQNIINSYIQTMEKTQAGLTRREKKARASHCAAPRRPASPFRRTLYVLGALLVFFAAGYLLTGLFGSLMANF